MCLFITRKHKNKRTYAEVLYFQRYGCFVDGVGIVNWTYETLLQLVSASNKDRIYTMARTNSSLYFCAHFHTQLPTLLTAVSRLSPQISTPTATTPEEGSLNSIKTTI
jgi:hypothetical protein